MLDMPDRIHTVLGFDFGKSRIGVALGRVETGMANPLDTVKAKAGKPEWGAIDKLVNLWEPDALVVGWPQQHEADTQAILKDVESFAKSLESRYHKPIYKVDERHTSEAAKRRLIEGQTKKPIKAQIDKVAAALIVETWLAMR